MLVIQQSDIDGPLANMQVKPGKLRLKDVQRRFDRVAVDFDHADFVHRTTFNGLIERLAPVSARPSIILDLGSASGSGSRKLARQFRRARIVSFDVSLQMLQTGKRRRSLLSKVTELQGDAARIPLQTGSADLVFSNLLLPWIDDLATCLGEIARVLRKDGVFVFSSLGPDSLYEIRDAWNSLDRDWHVNAFPDMHDIGDAIVRAGLRDPVLDVDTLSVTYRDTASLYRDLTNCGGRNSLEFRRRTLTGKNRLLNMDNALLRRFAGGPLALSLELVYGHAWGGGPPQTGTEYRLDPAAIGRRRR